MDKDGNIALGYSKSSTTVNPGIYITGRLATDPAGTMGAETEMQAGLGVQLGAGNRWGDYSAMTLDPIDQCTFYYTNEYLKTNGGFNWSTRIAAFKFPSCVSAANLYGTVTGTITSSQTNAPVPGVTVTLSNGYAGAANAKRRLHNPCPRRQLHRHRRGRGSQLHRGVASFGDCRTARWRHGYAKLHHDRYVEARGERLHD